jgi:peptidoglycan/xylan/chitin deacetylase (PgdA/CDA1 family)
MFGGALILGYHRIHQSNIADDELCVSPTHFGEHLEILQKQLRPIQLSELVQQLNLGTLPRRSVAVTFDDGYADNLANAVPLLQHYQIPATVFISTGYVGKRFWWEELTRMVISQPQLRDSLQLTIGADLFEWEAPQSFEKMSAPHARDVRIKLVNGLFDLLLPLPPEERESAMAQLRQWCGDPAEDGGSNRAFTSDELYQVAQNALIEIGSHTVTRAILSQIPVEQQSAEIQQSKAYLEKLLGKAVSGIAYPNGKFSAETQALVKQTGFAYACSSQTELVRHHQQRYALPRLWPKDWDGDRFSRFLQFWMGS